MQLNWSALLVAVGQVLMAAAQGYQEGDVRLVGGRHVTDGTVLIFHGQEWGTICDEHWDLRDARVVCRQLGFPGAAQAVHRSRFGRGRRQHLLSTVRCTGKESDLTLCPHSPWGRISRRCYPHSSTVAGVVCKPRVAEKRVPPTQPSSTTSTTTTTTTSTTTTTTPATTTTSTTIESTTMTTKKPSTTSTITPCTSTNMAAVKITKGDEEGNGTTENEVQADAPWNYDVQIRMLGGRYPWEGRLEIREGPDGVWGTICGKEWGLRETIVACRELGQEHGKQALQINYFGGEKMTKHFARISCSGRENRLSECARQRLVNGMSCSKPEFVAGVVCSSYLPDLIPNLKELQSSVFVQDRPLYYLQCALEENCLSNSAAIIRNTSRNWASNMRRLLRFSTMVENRGKADFRPYMAKSQWQWHQCHMHYHSMEVFAHFDIVDSRGNRLAEGSKASFCLEDSTCDRGVHPKFSCLGYGDQGLSVNCSDNYMNDIDCQWIDITDIKPGQYTFLMEINPQLLVAELNFDNNIASCDLLYTGYAAYFSNCHFESLL